MITACFGKRKIRMSTLENTISMLEVSRQQAAEGKCQEMGEALAEIRSKYGL